MPNQNIPRWQLCLFLMAMMVAAVLLILAENNYDLGIAMLVPFIVFAWKKLFQSE